MFQKNNGDTRTCFRIGSKQSTASHSIISQSDRIFISVLSFLKNDYCSDEIIYSMLSLRPLFKTVLLTELSCVRVIPAEIMNYNVFSE